jgi:murein DD-endopeptidase MepM/ murein hydrolase activator NlpD
MTGLEGEGVLNLDAMARPGVPQLLDALNNGRIKPGNVGSIVDTKGSRPGGSGGVGAGALFGMAVLMRKITETALITGLEVGISRAMSAFSPIDFNLANDQRRGLSDEQLSNAGFIVSTGRRMGASERDIQIALMTAMQESSLRNLSYGDDIYGVTNPDGSLTSSLGLFQQQKWWGTAGERMDPSKSSELFYNALFQVANRDQMATWEAAQAVQGSAYPMAYAQWEGLARTLLGAATTGGADINYGASSKERLESIAERLQEVKESQDGFMIPTTGMVSWLYGWRNMFADGPDLHTGIDIRAATGTPVFAPAPGIVGTSGWDSTGGGNMIRIDHGDGKSTMYLHLSKKRVQAGDRVNRGSNIGDVGNTGGRSLGSHLHFSVLRDGRFVDPNPYLARPVKVGDQVRPIGMLNGGTVPGTGRGDIIPAMLEPGEFVMSRAMADIFRPMLEAMNRGGVDFTPNLNALAHANDNARFKRDVDSGGNNIYNVRMIINEADSQIDFEGGVRRVMKQITKRQPVNRKITKGTS